MRNFQLLLLTVATSAAAYGRTAISPLQETMGHALALTDNQMALLQGPALALPVVLGAAPLGLAVDRYQRVRLLLVFMLIDLIGSVLTAWTAHFSVLLIARSLVGLIVSATNTTAFSLVADHYPPTQRGRAITCLAVGQYVGMAAAFALGGKLVAAFAGEPEGWRWALYCLCGPLILATLAMPLLREPPRTDVVVQNPSVRESWRELWRYRAVIAPLLIGMVTVEVAIGAALVWAAPTFTRDFNLAPDRIGAIMAAALLVSGIAGPVAGGVLADFCQRTGGPARTTVALTGLALVSTAAGLFALLPDAMLASVLLALFMTLVGALLVAGSALFMIVIPNEMRGLCMGVLSGACMLFGVGVAPLFVSLLSGVLGGGGAIGVALTSVCVVAGLLGAATFAFSSRAVLRTAVA